MLKLFKKDGFKLALAVPVYLLALVLVAFGVKAALYLFVLAIIISGAEVFVGAVRGILHGDFLDEKFLMSIASVGAVIIGEYSEGAAVMLFFLVGEAFEHRAVRRSRNSIRALMDICPDEATVLRGDTEVRTDADEVQEGDLILVRPGERVPVDSLIVRGVGEVDTSAMTGESLPRSVGVGDKLDSGIVLLNGIITCKALRVADESAAARVLLLVEEANESKSKKEAFITKFSRVYTPTVVALAVLIAVIPAAFGWLALSASVYRALIFLVISCPCALVISVPMAFFAGIGSAASRGILYKGGSVIESISRADTAVFDKTGTVTSGEFSVVKLLPDGISEERLLYLAASAESASNHPIALSLRKAYEHRTVPTEVNEIVGEGIISRVDGSKIAVGKAALMERVGAVIREETEGAVYVAENGKFVGAIVLADSPKPEAAAAICELNNLGIKRTAILSGDKRESVLRIAGQINVNEALFELSPEGKYTELEKIITETKNGVIYVGDGINDAPSLARADVGVAMGALGQDGAVEASDMVIATDNLSRLPEAVKIARKTVRIAKQNIVLALGVKLSVMLLGALGIANMWLAVFADVGVAVLAILNSMRAMSSP